MYVVNTRSKIAHVKPTLEQCNFDQAKPENRDEHEFVPTGYRICKHCAKR